MFYELLYKELGKLFYYTANIDGKIQSSEREALKKLIEEHWAGLEESTDEFGSDQSGLIAFSFDFEEAEGLEDYDVKAFAPFYIQYKDKFTPSIRQKILLTCDAIGKAHRGDNSDEREIVEAVQYLFEAY